MSEEVATTEAPATEGTESKPETPAVVDPKAELNAALKKAGVKLKVKGKEYAPRDIDELVSKAQRVHGIESYMEEAKAEKAEAAKLKAWREALEADDDEAAARAFEELPTKARANAAKWLDRQAAKFEKEKTLPPEALEERRRREETEAQLSEYRKREKEAAEKSEKERRAAEVREAHGHVLKVATEAIKALKANEKAAPALVPAVAKHMRLALEAAAAEGRDVDEAEIAAVVSANVREEVMESFASVASSMDDAALFDALGPAIVKRLAKEALARRGRAPVTTEEVRKVSQGAPKPLNGDDPKKDPKWGTPAYFR